MVLLTPRFPPDLTTCISARTSFTFLRGITILAVFSSPSANSQCRSSSPSLNTNESHWAQLLLHIGPRSLLSFYSGRCPGSISRIIGPKSLSAKCSLLRACRSQTLAAAAATIPTLCPSARCSTFWQCEHTSGHGRLERASAFVCRIS